MMLLLAPLLALLLLALTGWALLTFILLAPETPPGPAPERGSWLLTLALLGLVYWRWLLALATLALLALFATV